MPWVHCHPHQGHYWQEGKRGKWLWGRHTAVSTTALKNTSLAVAVPRDGNLGGGRLQGPAEDTWGLQRPCTPAGPGGGDLCTDPSPDCLLLSQP